LIRNYLVENGYQLSVSKNGKKCESTEQKGDKNVD
jgi:hypothetical protein